MQMFVHAWFQVKPYTISAMHVLMQKNTPLLHMHVHVAAKSVSITTDAATKYTSQLHMYHCILLLR